MKCLTHCRQKEFRFSRATKTKAYPKSNSSKRGRNDRIWPHLGTHSAGPHRVRSLRYTGRVRGWRAKRSVLPLLTQLRHAARKDDEAHQGVGSPNGRYGISGLAASFRLDVGRPDNLGPLVRVFNNELAES
jgi:hypothetical protein